MMNIIEKYSNKFLNIFGCKIIRKNKKSIRGAIKKAKEVFKDREIIACEVGVFKGEHALQILKNLNVKKLYLIDPYKEYNDYKDYRKDSNNYHNLKEVKKAARKCLKKFDEKIVWVEKFSNKALRDINEKLDFVYIDGNHETPYINNDIQNFFPLIKYGGIISGHDYSSDFPDVINTVFELSKKINKPIFFGEGTDWLFIK